MIYFTTKEATNIFNVDSKTISSWCKKGYFPNAIKGKDGNKVWRIPEHDIEKLKSKWKQEDDNKEKYFTINEVREIFKVSKSLVLQWLRKGYLPNTKKIRNQSSGKNTSFISERDLQVIKKNYKVNELNLQFKYYSANEAGKLLGVSHFKVLNWIKQGRLPNSVSRDYSWVIPETDICNLRDELDGEKSFLLDAFYDVKQITRITKNHSRTVLNHIKQGMYSTKILVNNKYYVSKTEVHEKLSISYESVGGALETNDISNEYLLILESAEFLKISQSRVKYLISTGRITGAIQNSINKRWFIPLYELKKVKICIQLENELKDKCYSLKEAAGKLRISPERVKKLITSAKNSSIKPLNGTFYIEKLEIERYRDKLAEEKNKLHEVKCANYIQFKQAHKELGITNVMWRNLSHKCAHGKIDGCIKIGRRWFISKVEIENFIKCLKESEPDDILEAFKLRITKTEYMGEHIRNTVQMYIEWFSEIYGNSDNSKPKNLLYIYSSVFKTIVKNIEREIYLYNNVELNFIFVKNKNILKSHFSDIYKFLNYVRFQMGRECNYNQEFTFKKSIYQNPNKEIYTKEEFMLLYTHLKNVRYHLNEGLKNATYMRTWLYLLMHFTNAWRKDDILKLPNVDVEEVRCNELEWFNNNDFSLAQAHIIIDQIKYKWEILDISKTCALNKFFVHLDMMIPLTVALCIVEFYRRMNNSERLLEKIPTNKQIENFFNGIKQLRNFGNRLTNRSLLSHLYFSITENDGTGDLSHILLKRLRGHISDESTPIYIIDHNNEGNLDDSSYHLLRRGHFGWLYSMMIDIIINSRDKVLSKEEKTILIEKYQQIYSPQNLENISSFLINRQQATKTIGMELINMPENVLKRRLEDIYRGELPSRHLNIQCFHSNDCPTKGASCVQCPYKIPIIYSLTSIKHEINKIITEIEKLQENRINERKRNTMVLSNLMDVLNQAAITFGRAYVNEYINISDLKVKLQSIKIKLLQ